jgi:hypothetical protein
MPILSLHAPFIECHTLSMYHKLLNLHFGLCLVCKTDAGRTEYELVFFRL